MHMSLLHKVLFQHLLQLSTTFCSNFSWRLFFYKLLLLPSPLLHKDTRTNVTSVASNKHTLLQRITLAHRPVALVTSDREAHAY